MQNVPINLLSHAKIMKTLDSCFNKLSGVFPIKKMASAIFLSFINLSFFSNFCKLCKSFAIRYCKFCKHFSVDSNICFF